MPPPIDVFVSVAETSADIHAAAMVRTAARRLPDCRFYGLTGPRLRSLGVDTVFDLTAHAAMLTDAFSIIGLARRAMAAVERAWDERAPAVVVLLDSPELHLPLAERARRRGLKVLYYIAPQTWASREGRNRRIARCVDRLACILPFEEPFFRAAGVPAEFVGHPLFETLRQEQPRGDRVAALRNGAGQSSAAVIALLPGSRRGVIQAVLPLQLEAVRQLRARGVRARVAVSAVSSAAAQQISRILSARDEARAVEVVVDDNASLLSAADLVLVASGTAVLHVAYYRKPMIVMYDAGPLLNGLHHWLGRFVLKTPHLSLVNILAGARVVPEFMPSVGDISAVARVAEQLLRDQDWRRLMSAQLDALVKPLEATAASDRVCALLRAMLGQGAASD